MSTPAGLLRAALLFGALLLAGCRSVPTASLENVVPPGTAGFALDPIPTPADATLEPRVALVGEFRVTGGREGEPALRALARMIDAPATEGARAELTLGDLPNGPPESFEITVTLTDEGVSITLLGADPAGRHWAAQTLRQLVCEKDGRRWVRLGRIRDRPAFPFRGNKRPLVWEALYRANFTHEGGDDPELLAVGREHFVAVLSPGGVLDATETGVAAAERFFDEWSGRGCRLFAIEFDDVGFNLDEASRERFGSYGRALSVYLAACRERLRRIDPGATLYWLPQTYWTDDERLPVLARELGEGGGAPPDVGLILTGPEIISDTIDRADIEKAQRAFGLTRKKALVYDNRGREGDHGPLRGRDAALVAQVDAVFGERGEFLNRITRLDWSWNPAAYDPERSLLLACREIVGPAAAPRLKELVLEGPRATGERRRRLYEEVLRLLDPPARAPVRVEEYVDRVRRDIEAAAAFRGRRLD